MENLNETNQPVSDWAPMPMAENAARDSLEWVRTQEEERKKRLAGEKEDNIRKKKRKAAVQLIFLILFFVIFLSQAGQVAAVFLPEKPLRNGTHATDLVADQCIHNLWKISSALQDNKDAPLLTCPESGQAYVFEKTREGVTASCPHPHKHGLSRLLVTTQNPIPEVKK